MFYLRAVLISLAEFVIVYAGLRVLIGAAWRPLSRRTNPLSPSLLYLLQVGPFLLSLSVVAALTIPSFLRLEPRFGEEELGAPLIFFSALAVVMLSVGFARALNAIFRTSRLVRLWQNNATAHHRCDGLHVVNTGPDSPPLAVAGLLRPNLYISSSAQTLLNADELRLAIAHEAEHIRRHDNIKKLFLRVCSVPASSIERFWLASIEVAADVTAVRSKREALDLASALVKASQIAAPTPDLAMNFTMDGTELLRIRVERLLSWESVQQRLSKRAIVSIGAAALAAFAVLVVTYPTLLVAMHEFSEFIVR